MIYNRLYQYLIYNRMVPVHDLLNRLYQYRLVKPLSYCISSSTLKFTTGNVKSTSNVREEKYQVFKKHGRLDSRGVLVLIHDYFINTLWIQLDLKSTAHKGEEGWWWWWCGGGRGEEGGGEEGGGEEGGGEEGWRASSG